jgi:cytidine deaminase
MKRTDLVRCAKEAMKHAYVKYSQFPVGAAVVTGDGRVFLGANIESASYGLSLCAERVALFKVYSEGCRDIEAIAVIGDTDEPIAPCGACRQIMCELAPNAKVYLSNRDMTQVVEYTPDDLLPFAFRL